WSAGSWPSVGVPSADPGCEGAGVHPVTVSAAARARAVAARPRRARHCSHHRQFPVAGRPTVTPWPVLILNLARSGYRAGSLVGSTRCPHRGGAGAVRSGFSQLGFITFLHHKFLKPRGSGTRSDTVTSVLPTVGRPSRFGHSFGRSIGVLP